MCGGSKLKLKKGLYEQVINRELNEEIKKNIENVDIYKEIIDQTDSSRILSTYLSYIVNKGLNYYKSSNEDVFKQIEITNRLINLLSNTIEDTDFENYMINENNLLKGIFENDTSSTGQRYINQRKNKNNVLIFVREYRSENSITSPFYFLGKANYISHTGSKPISIVWEMEKPIPAFILKRSNKIVDII